MRSLMITVLLCAFALCLPASTWAAYIYWVPFTSDVFGPSGGGSSVSGTSLADGNHIEVDVDLDGIPDQIFDLDAGQGTGGIPAFTGMKITATSAVHLVYTHSFSDHGSYEDGTLQYVLLPERAVGDDYWVPLDGSNSSVLAIADQTTINYDANNDGVPENTWVLDTGDDQQLAIVAGGHFWGDKPFYLVGINHLPSHYDHTFGYAALPVSELGTFYTFPEQHGFSHNSSTDTSGVHIVSAEDGVTVNIGANQQVLDEGDTWFFQTSAEGDISADGKIFAVYLSRVQGMDPWDAVMRYWEFAITMIPANFNVKGLYTRGRNINTHGGPEYQLFIGSYSDANQVDFTCLVTKADYTTVLDRGDIFYLRETDTPIDCWKTQLTQVTSTAPIQVGFSRRSWWSGLSETTNGYAIAATPCECELDAECDDRLFCTGVETCLDCSCIDGVAPCVDDELWCNGEESCNEDAEQCEHSGDPCDEWEKCNEELDECELDVDDDDDNDNDDNDDNDTDEPDLTDDDSPDEGDDDQEDLWPEGKVTGGCCGCD